MFKFKKSSIGLVLGLVLPNLAACSTLGGDNFYFANFQSYISDDLLSDIRQESNNKFNLITFGTNEFLERNFSTNYDIAVASVNLIDKFAKANQIKKIDWSKFDLYELNEDGSKKNGTKITTAKQALSLFSPTTQAILTKAYPGFNKDDGGILQYMVPYFLQDVIFAYQKQSADQTIFAKNDLKWSEIKTELLKAADNKLINRVSTIADEATLFQIAQIVDSELNRGGKIEELQKNTLSIEDYIRVFNSLFGDFYDHKNTFFFNTDSNIVLNNFAAQTSNEAILSYNGDVLYGALGGDEFGEDGFEDWISTKLDGGKWLFDLIRPKNTLSVLDGFVINANTQKEDEAYEYIKKIALENADDKDMIIKKEGEGDDESYISGPMINFDYVKYTSPLKLIDNYVLKGEPIDSTKKSTMMNGQAAQSSNSRNGMSSMTTTEEQSKNPGKGYFEDNYGYLLTDEIMDKNTYDDFIKTLKNIYKLNDPVNDNPATPSGFITEINISDLNKSNRAFAFDKVLNNL